MRKESLTRRENLTKFLDDTRESERVREKTKRFERIKVREFGKNFREYEKN